MNDIRINPYVGPYTFTREQRDLFFGRKLEARNLLALVIAERLVLFYAQSGAGKSSLINTCLIPDLEEEGFKVLPIGRVGITPPSDGKVDNIFIHNLQSSLSQQNLNANPLPNPNVTLKDFLHSLAFTRPTDNYNQPTDFDGGEPPPRVLIIDQFEEIFTTHLEAWGRREGFFKQLREVLEDDDRLWIVLVMREDYVAALTPYVHLLPDKLRARLYLERLEYKAALEAVKKPAALYGRTFAKDVATILINDLRRLQLGHSSPLFGQYVEPVHLQIVCRRLWDRLPSDRKIILEEDLGEAGNVNQALTDFYEDCLKKVLPTYPTLSERHLRAWVDTYLITPSRTRGLVQQKENETGGLPNTAVDILCEARLIRTERRGQNTWYELTHDRLIEPIQTRNTKWFEQNLSTLQRQADLWDKRKRPGDLLLRDYSLKEAEQWAKDHPDVLTDTEKEFLIASQEAREVIKQKRRQVRRLRIIFSLLFCVILCTLCEAIRERGVAQNAKTIAETERNRAEDLTKITQANQLAAQTLNHLDNLDQALLLSVEASKEMTGAQVMGSLTAALEASPHLVAYLQGHRQGVNGVAFSPDGGTLASVSSDDTLRLWHVPPLAELLNGQAVAQPNGSPLAGRFGDNILSVAFSPKAQILASGGCNTIILWDADTHKRLYQLAGHADCIDALAFSPDGTILASGSRDKTIRLWKVATGQPIGQPLLGHTDDVRGLAFSPKGEILVSGGEDQTILLWDLSRSQPISHTLGVVDNWVTSLAFRPPKGEILAAASYDKITLWDVSSGQQKDTVIAHAATIFSLAFSLDGHWLASGSADKTISLWDLTTGQSDRLAGHHSWVRSVAFSPDGQTLASGGDDGAVILWDVTSRQRLAQTLTTHPQQITSIAASPNGNAWAYGGDGGVIVLSSAVNNWQPLSLTGHTNRVNSLAFNPKGQLLASAGDDQQVLLWDAATGQQWNQPLAGHTEGVWSVAFNPQDDRLLASGGLDGRVILWNVTGTHPLSTTLSGHTGSVWSVAFSPNGQTLASAGEDGTIVLWNLATAQIIRQLEGQHEKGVISVVFSPDGQTLASGSQDTTIILWDVATGRLLHQLKGHKDSVMQVAFSQDGGTLASGSLDKTIRLWDVTSGTAKGPPLKGHNLAIYNVLFVPGEDQILLSGSRDGTIRWWNVQTDQPLRDQPLTGPASQINSLAFSPNGKVLASAGGKADSTIVLWNVSSNTHKTTLDSEHQVTSLVFASNGQTLVGGSDNGEILSWNVATGEVYAPLVGHTDQVNSVAFSDVSGKVMLASGSDDRAVILWNFAVSPMISQTLTAHTDAVNSVVFSPDGKTLASGSADDTIILWDTATGKPIGRPLEGHEFGVTSLAFSPDGQTLASGSEDDTIILWDVATKQPKFPPLTDHFGTVTSLAFISDGHILASGSEDDKIILWDVTTGQRVAPPLGAHKDDVTSIAFSPDDQTLASAGLDGVTNLWDVNLKSWQTRACRLAARNLTWLEWNQFFPNAAYHKTCEDWPIHPTVLKAAQDLARAGQKESAVVQFEYLRKLDSTLDLNPTTAALDTDMTKEADRLAIEGQARRDYDQGLTFYDQKEYDQAIEKFNQAIGQDPNQAEYYKSRGHAYAQTGNYKSTIADFDQAGELDPDNAANYANSACWFGSLLDHAADVMDACDRAVKLASDDGQIYDSRGLARALTGNTAGAIKDFEFFVEWSKQTNSREDLRSEREAWIAALKKKQNPFDAQTLKSLWDE